ncbi:aldose 1-epimerase [Cordyceps fumosorosea ARSEF 2679]|uniref:Aldose 1-epimerase n=1 Tax=Cordyceps fumosorosea (strain ARSEF 2679) TaxID=1081104 RepID=A0A167MXX2_CORFA|nr:aldose 1-epimerase [Cordyceps fumosorosea ARSEF 2679]OAA54883.1 aldose 1-epimerase [Cordyceps fumosorosea ARSEF 2679]
MRIASHLAALAATAALPWLASAVTSANSTSSGPDKDGKYWIEGDGLRAAFIPYGASVSNILIKDRRGVERDIVAGWDNATYYTEDKLHPHFGGVPGRYANRIKNSSFVLDGHTYHILPNENPTPGHPDGVDTLHGGPDGWDWRNFTVVSHTRNSVTFMILDPDGKEGFPGEVISYITYTLQGMDWHIKMIGLATTKRTPIMLSSHTYWNLDGFANDETDTALNHTLHLPYSGQRVAVDNILIPTGEFWANKNGSVNDFWSQPRQIGHAMGEPDLVNNCGFNCTGYDNCFLVNRDHLGPFDWRTEGPVARLASPWSGIGIDVYTDQQAFQVYSCNGMDGTVALKQTQGSDKFARTISKYGCVVMEVQDYIDGINNPEWMRDSRQVFGPGDDPYVLQATYKFKVDKD